MEEPANATLMQLKPPQKWRDNIKKSISEMLGERNLEERLAEISGIIEQMDKRWDNGFITSEQEYMEKRLKLQMELAKLSPVADDDLEKAADRNRSHHRSS